MQAVILPILEANMTHGVVRAWLKREGEVVAAGEPLFEVETDKVNAEVEAESSGVLRCIAAPVGTRVPVLSVVALIGSADEAVPPPEAWSDMAPAKAPAGLEAPSVPTAAQPPPSVPPAAAATTPDAAVLQTAAPAGAVRVVAASPAARRLARERGVALEQIRPTGPRGEVTRADVEAALSAPRVAAQNGVVDPSFLELLRRDAGAIRGLSSDAKIQLYRQHGAQIGERVRIEPGALILAHEVRIGAGSSIGADSTIECERVQLGRLVAFGKRTRVRCRSVEIGDALWSKDDVVLGGGGSEEPGARLRAGDACFFGEAAYLNTCHPLTLGDEVCIGSRAMLFTHSHWQSMLRGYSSLFGPIDIGNHVFIGNTAFVFPGVTIGSGATVMVNSFVAVNVPPDTFVGGVPAHVIRHIVTPTREQQINLLRERLLPELGAALKDGGYAVTTRAAGERIVLDVGGGAAVQFCPVWEGAAAAGSSRLVVLAFATGAPSLPPGVTLFDLHASRVFGPQDRLSDAVREFCRRRGIRFRPFAWRFGVGHFEGDTFVSRADRS